MHAWEKKRKDMDLLLHSLHLHPRLEWMHGRQTNNLVLFTSKIEFCTWMDGEENVYSFAFWVTPVICSAQVHLMEDEMFRFCRFRRWW
jgi:hypothetical protein